MKRDRASELRAIADGRLMLNVRNGVTVSRSMLAMIADEFEAMSTALAAKDAELARLTHDWERQWLQERDLKCQTIDHAESLVTELAAAKLAQEANHNLAVANGNRAREEHNRAERAEAQLAEANKALEPFARIAAAEDFAGTKDGESIIVNVNLCRAARCALEAQGRGNG